MEDTAYQKAAKLRGELAALLGCTASTTYERAKLHARLDRLLDKLDAMEATHKGEHTIATLYLNA